jgi:3-dehydrotetronate 4-kinase
MSKILIGCIADDFTGATDLASNFVQSGMRVLQAIGVPVNDLSEEVDVVVIALKTRTTPVDEAVSQSLQALEWLKKCGASQIYFKYCSTFDSTTKGNIGPVIDALMHALNCDFTIACPAFPENSRTIYKGHLFVGDVLLQDSGMKDHPLTPMRDSNLVRILSAQTKHSVGLIEWADINCGSDAISVKMRELKKSGVGIAIVDAISNQDLEVMGKAFADLPLITAGSGVAIGLPQNFGIYETDKASELPKPTGYQAIISGSCSVATNNQVAHFIKGGGQAHAINPFALLNGDEAIDGALNWAAKHLKNGPVLIYATADSQSLKKVHTEIGAKTAGDLVERALSEIAYGLIEQGARQIVIAGGETSGACVKRLKINNLKIGKAISPGVPWCYAKTPASKESGIHITLKSGNFGKNDFFTNAFNFL